MEQLLHSTLGGERVTTVGRPGEEADPIPEDHNYTSAPGPTVVHLTPEDTPEDTNSHVK